MCGVFGAVARTSEAEADIGKIAYVGLFDLQHRGQESAGISAWRDGAIVTRKAMGTIDWVFRPYIGHHARIDFIRANPHRSPEELAEELALWERDHHNAQRAGASYDTINPLDDLSGRAAIGHVRYSTTGESGNKNAQPIGFVFRGTPGEIAHNGNLVGLDALRALVRERDPHIVFSGSTDTELIATLLSTSPQGTFEEALKETLLLLEGAFSLVILYGGMVYAVRDRFGLRPLFVGKNRTYELVASETGALDTIGAGDIREVEPGSIWRLGGSGVTLISYWAPHRPQSRTCVFETIYLSRHDSLSVRFKRVHTLRKQMGRVLYEEHPIPDADIVGPVLDSGLSYAMGYAQSGSLPFDTPLVRGRVGRTFIEPVKEVRRDFQQLKHHPIPDEVRGKHVVLIDDSIVRGTTMPRIVARLRTLGVKKISVLIASPPLRYGCHLGVDMPTREELIAHGKTEEGVRLEIGADYLGYLSLEGMYKAMEMPSQNFCDGCLTGEYPVPPDSK